MTWPMICITRSSDHINGNDYALYGHSMGGVVAFLLSRKIIANKHRRPLHLFITGTTGPTSASRQEKQLHRLGKQAFIAEIRELDGCPEEVLQNEDLMNYVEPILRADFQASETFTYVRDRPLDIPITVITGTHDDMKTEDVRLWQQETTCTIDFIEMPGKHFFILDASGEIVDIIGNKLFSAATNPAFRKN
jgi:surfactin synthase thioesterase subunit